MLKRNDLGAEGVRGKVNIHTGGGDGVMEGKCLRESKQT